MAHHADPVSQTLTQKTKPMNAAAKMPIQFSPLLPVWPKPKRVEVTHAACQKPELRRFVQVQQEAGNKPEQRDDVDAPRAIAFDAEDQEAAHAADDQAGSPPEVDAARERGLQVAAQRAFFKAADEKERRRPRRRRI